MGVTTTDLLRNHFERTFLCIFKFNYSFSKFTPIHVLLLDVIIYSHGPYSLKQHYNLPNLVAQKTWPEIAKHTGGDIEEFFKIEIREVSKLKR